MVDLGFKIKILCVGIRPMFQPGSGMHKYCDLGLVALVLIHTFSLCEYGHLIIPTS